jgi:hypothetical protein
MKRIWATAPLTLDLDIHQDVGGRRRLKKE